MDKICILKFYFCDLICDALLELFISLVLSISFKKNYQLIILDQSPLQLD